MSSNNTGKTIRERLFFALWPDAVVRQAIFQVQNGLSGIRGRKVPDVNLHITLAFLGNCTQQQRACLIDQADRIKVEPFSLTLDQLGYWHRPQVVLLGSHGKVPQELLNLVGALQLAMLNCGLIPEQREFQSHMTLLRKVARVESLPPISPVEWPVAEYRLLRSITSPEGVGYQTVKSWPCHCANFNDR